MATWGDRRGVIDLLRRTGHLWWRNGPWLVAIYLISWLARYGVIALAARVAFRYGDVFGELLIPAATLIRILSYVAMVWVMRSSVVATTETGNGGARARVDSLLTVILPVFLLLAAWKLFQSDRFDYEQRIGEAVLDHHPPPTQAPAWVMYLIIALAALARFLLTRLRDKLPTWTHVVAIFLEATWLTLLASATQLKLFGTPRWIAERRIVVWYLEQKNELLSHFGIFGKISEWFGWFGGYAMPTLLLPLTWVAVVGIILRLHPESTWTATGHRIASSASTSVSQKSTEVAERVRRAWSVYPSVLRTRAQELVSGFIGVLDKLGDTIRLVIHAGPVVLGGFLLAFMTLVWLYPSGAYFDVNAGDGYLWRGIAHLLGPHDFRWWLTYTEPIRIVVGAIIEPLRIALVVALYWMCLDRVEDEAKASD